jgi:hypothetical protein
MFKMNKSILYQLLILKILNLFINLLWHIAHITFGFQLYINKNDFTIIPYGPTFQILNITKFKM